MEVSVSDANYGSRYKKNQDTEKQENEKLRYSQLIQILVFNPNIHKHTQNSLALNLHQNIFKTS